MVTYKLSDFLSLCLCNTRPHSYVIEPTRISLDGMQHIGHIDVPSIIVDSGSTLIHFVDEIYEVIKNMVGIGVITITLAHFVCLTISNI